MTFEGPARKQSTGPRRRLPVPNIARKKSWFTSSGARRMGSDTQALTARQQTWRQDHRAEEAMSIDPQRISAVRRLEELGWPGEVHAWWLRQSRLEKRDSDHAMICGVGLPFVCLRALLHLWAAAAPGRSQKSSIVPCAS